MTRVPAGIPPPLGVASFWHLLVFGLAGLAVAGISAQTSPPPEVLHYPDLLLYNGKVLTADDAFSVAQAIAVRDGTILAVGRDDEIVRLAGPETRKVNLQGKVVVPGFIDAHFHLHRFGSEGFRLSVNGATVQSAIDDLKSIVSRTPAGQVIYAHVSVPRGTSSKAEWELTRHTLDQVSSQHPILLDNTRMRMVANTLALRQAGALGSAEGLISAGTFGVVKDPATGEPNGQLELAAYGVMRAEYVPWVPIERIIPGLVDGMRKFNALGVTLAATRVPGNELTALRELYLDNALTMRWRPSLEDIIDENPRSVGYLKRIGNLSDIGDDMLRIMGAHPGATDGRLGEGTAFTSSPRQLAIPGDSPWSWVGLHGWDRWGEDGVQHSGAVAAVQYGWNAMGIHTEGDAAAAKVLQAFEQGLADQVVRTKHQRLAIDHWTMASQSQIQRGKALGKLRTNASMQALVLNDESMSFYGGDRIKTWLPLKSLIRAGLKPSLAMDGTREPSANPFWQMEKAITRTDATGRILGGEEAVNRQEALWMYTNWAAYYTGDQDRLGTLQPGKLADLVILDRDFMTIAAEEISEIRPLMTFLNGKAVYTSPAAKTEMLDHSRTRHGGG